jgi:hypothetical protein
VVAVSLKNERICEQLDVPHFSCRGYTSQSEMWSAAQRLIYYREEDQTPVIFHLGDHDPSGIDMSRDIKDRLQVFMDHHGVEVTDFDRLALNMDQVDEHNPPPNPAKLTDSRAKVYIQKFGDDSWELDALDPVTMSGIIRDAILRVRDDDLWEEKCEEEDEAKKVIQHAAENWEVVREDYREND